MMKNLVYLLFLAIVITGCKNEKKQNSENEKQETGIIEVVQEEAEEEIELPPNTVQLNEYPQEYPEENITLTKVQVVETGDNSFLLKMFFKTSLPELYKNGDYLMFVQNYPFENSIDLLDKASIDKGFQALYANLDSAKPYKDEYVVFRSFKSEIYDFEKIIIGIRDNVNNRDVFREQYDFASIND
jgi:hypothetical protein